MKTARAYFLSLAKSNFSIWIALTTLVTMFFVMTTSVFSSFARSTAYSSIVTVFPVIYAVVVGNKLIAEKVEKGTMSSFLIANNSRLKLAFTSAVYFVVSTFAMWTIATAVGLLAGVIAKKEMDVSALVLVNVGAFVYHVALCGICFVSSCFFNTSRASLAVGGGVCVVFYLLSTLSGLVESLEFFKYMTITTLYDVGAIFAAEPCAWQFCTLALVGVLLMGAGVVIFDKKDLPI